jgi:hypothetical protein
MKPRRSNAEHAEPAENGAGLRALRSILPIVICIALGVAPARATMVVAADLGELTRDARAIVMGRVMALDARWTDDRRTIETIVTLEVEGYLKGALGQTLQFRVPGGELGRLRSITVGAPEFAVDEHVVVFLGATGPSIPHVLGFNQGVFRVVRAADNRWMVTPPPMLPSASTVRVVRGDSARRPLPLADFQQRVRALAGGAQ